MLIGSTVRFGLALKFAATTILVAAGAVLLPVSPAAAAVCPGATGVTVVVDFNQLGGGVKTGCAATGGGKASSVNFPAAGFPLTYVLRSPGFVCRVSGKPTTDACVVTPPVTKYWSLWWSDGKTGTWSYSSLGVGSLKVPTGGYVAFSWQGQATKSAPGLTPTKRAGLVPAPSDPASSEPPKAPKPTKSPSKSPTKSPSQSPSKPAQQPGKTDSPSPSPGETSPPAGEASPTASESPSVSPSASDKESESADPSESLDAEASDDASDDAEVVAAVTDDPPSTGGSDGVPPWVTVSLFVALAGAIGGVAYWRGRRTGTSPSP